MSSPLIYERRVVCRMKKRKYLFRLITIVILMLIFPLILFFDLLWKKSFNELERANQIYYDKVISSYISFYDELVRSLNTFAANISVESIAKQKTFWSGVEEIGEDSFQLYKVATGLNEEYNLRDVSGWGIYLYDSDKIIRNGKTLSAIQYIYTMESEFGENEQLSEFFSVDNYSPGNKLFCTTNGRAMYDGDLLVGICTEIGVDKYKSLVFFVLSSGDMENSSIIMDEQGMEFYLIDDESKQIMLSWGDNAGANIENVVSMEDTCKIAGREQKVLYKKDSNYTEFSIAVYISEEAMQRNVVEYAYGMRKLLLLTTGVLLLICMYAIYYAYKPIYELTSELDYSEEGELDAIRNLLDDRYSKISEQEMLIMDLLLNHLMYGVHVSEERIKCLGVENTMRYYCVFLLKGYILANSEVERIVGEIEKKYHSRLFVTDWQGENSSVFILFSKNSDISVIEQYLRRWLEKSFIKKCDLYAGEIVERMDDIQTSLRSCFEQAEKKNEIEERKKARMEAVDAREEMQRKLKEDILAYLELNYRDPCLSQAQVADIFRISVYTLSRLFKNQVGVGFAEYLVAKRIEYAKELLLATSHSVNEIASMAGFSSANHFSKSFKLYVGVSPTVFREQI